ncbi:Structure-specific endonuclease subunit SLX1 [Gaertneriomyces sp. JEL0708]|nr:Structure-specific endonuclease subunit SLX1 [Gaertneriomyces sp. JEL0708]
MSGFYACYLLASANPRFKTHAYVGSTPDPHRRIRQHNGEITGGAMKTSKKRPWDMVLIVHGFPNKYAALQFEWAWQKPHESRHFTQVYPGVYKGSRKELQLDGKLKVLSDMLGLDQWVRWPLHLHFTAQSAFSMFATLPMAPPKHVSITCQLLSELPMKLPEPVDVPTMQSMSDCVVCMDAVSLSKPATFLSCTTSSCRMLAHLLCLSDWFLNEEKKHAKSVDQLLPVSGSCPLCREELLWGDLIRDMKNRCAKFGNYRETLVLSDSDSEANDDEDDGDDCLARHTGGDTRGRGKRAMTREHVRARTLAAVTQAPRTGKAGRQEFVGRIAE